MDFIEQWNRLVALRQPVLEDVAGKAKPAFPGHTPFFAVGSNILVETASMTVDDGRAPVLSASLVLEPRLLSAESLVRPERLPRFRILGLDAPFSAAQLRNSLETRGPRGYTLSSQLGQWEAHVGPLAFVFFPLPGAEESLDQAMLGMVRFFFQAPTRSETDPRIEAAS